MILSVIIPFRNDWEEVNPVISNLLATAEESSEVEIIVVNDGSFSHNGKFSPLMLDIPNTRVINNPIARGVGYSFDRGVEAAKGDIIVLMGCDIYTQQGWDKKVVKAVTDNPHSIGCAVCMGDKPRQDGTFTKYYGADMLITVDKDDLPMSSKLRQRANYTDIFKGKWRTNVVSDDINPISCLMGAFYSTSKRYYQFIGGWDTDPKEIWQGHRQYGHLEPYLSLKSWLAGGGCYLHSNIEATHIFNRKGEHRFSKGSRSLENIWFNALFLLETCVFDDNLRERIYNFVYPELNFNLARKLIKKNYQNVNNIRNRNRSIFVNDIIWFADRFGINIKV